MHKESAVGMESTKPKKIRGMENLNIPTSLIKTKEDIIKNDDETNETKNIDHEGSKRKVKENHDSHRFSQKEAFSDNTKKDDTKENNETKNIDHEGSKQKVKENHDSHDSL